MDTLIGSVLHERFRVEEYLGGGSMADVYRGIDLRSGTAVAIKVLRPAMAQSFELVERFRREADALARLQHPNIVGQYGSGQHGDHVYIAMQFVEGDALSTEIAAAHGPMSVRRVLQISSDICSALSYLHAQGVIHRDVKPGNILIERATGRAVLTDFGIARVADAATMTSFAIGTPAYMSPEQARGHAIDGRSDIYAFACVLYEMMAGIKPFRGERSPYERSSTHAIVYEQMMQPCDPMRLYNPEIAVEAEMAVGRALAKAPASRFADASELADALHAGMTVPGQRALRIVAPADASVGVDGVQAGTGTVVLAAVPDGRHGITAVAPGCEPFSAVVDVPQTETLFVNMTKVDGTPHHGPVTRQAPLEYAPHTAQPSPQADSLVRPTHGANIGAAAPAPALAAQPPMYAPPPVSAQPDRHTGRAAPPPPPPPPVTGDREGRDGGAGPWAWYAASALAIVAAASIATAGVWWWTQRDPTTVIASNTPVATATVAEAMTPPATAVPASSATAPISPPPATITAPVSPPRAPLGSGRVTWGIVWNLSGSDWVFLRPAPSTKQGDIGHVGENARVMMVDDQAVAAEGHTWRHVQTDDGKVGWIAQEYLQLSTVTENLNVSDSNGSATLTISGYDVQPQSGVVLLDVSFRNAASGSIRWTSDQNNPAIFLIDGYGRQWRLLEAGADFGRDFSTFEAGTSRYGWLRFDNPDPSYRGPVTLNYPNHGYVTFTLDPP
jgi:hypothetical protein